MAKTAEGALFAAQTVRHLSYPWGTQRRARRRCFRSPRSPPRGSSRRSRRWARRRGRSWIGGGEAGSSVARGSRHHFVKIVVWGLCPRCEQRRCRMYASMVGVHWRSRGFGGRASSEALEVQIGTRWHCSSWMVSARGGWTVVDCPVPCASYPTRRRRRGAETAVTKSAR